MAEISIVIPVYNAGNYLDRCLQSIVSQTFRSIEIILVDDGSTDESLQICQEYASRDPRFQVVHQSNQGPSSARNAALDRVKGKYVCFVDADDCFSSNDSLKDLYTILEETEADLCIYSWNRIEPDGEVRAHFFAEDEMADNAKALVKTLLKGNYRAGGGNPWNKIWRVSSIMENGKIHSFPPEIKVYEDMLWTIQAITKIEKIVFLNKPLYNYYILNTSISRGGHSLERGLKYLKGAEKVLSYVDAFCDYAKEEAEKWYRQIYTEYLIEKVRARQKFTKEEIKVVRSLPSRPQYYDNILMWRRAWILKLAARIPI